MTLRIGSEDFDRVVYDERADVLYLSVGEPREPASQEATKDGHLVRYDEQGKVIGITIVNVKWLIQRDGGVRLPIHVPAEDLAPALAD
jgi:uncharacterized protein YuzE